jgi:predicted transcriptional regulator
MHHMSQHFTIRLQDETAVQLEQRARALGTKPRTLATRYIEEALRREVHPLIRFADGPAGRRAAVLGAPLDVWEIIATVRDNAGNPREAAEHLSIEAALVDAAIAYYGAYREEVDAMIRGNEEESARAHAAYRAGRESLAP